MGEANLLNEFVKTLKSEIHLLPSDDMQSIANEKYLNHSMVLEDEKDQKQIKVFEKKRSKNKQKEKRKLQAPSSIIKDTYVEKEHQRALWNDSLVKNNENEEIKDEKKEVPAAPRLQTNAAQQPHAYQNQRENYTANQQSVYYQPQTYNGYGYGF